MLAYPLTIVTDSDGSFLVSCANLPELTSFGASVTDAIAQGTQALAEALAARLDDFSPIPAPSSGVYMAEVDLQMTLKVYLFWSLRDADMTRADLARSLGLHRPQIDRLFDPNHATRLDQYDAAFRALGRKPVVTLVAA